MDSEYKGHVVLPNIEGEFPRQECFIVCMIQPKFNAVAWVINDVFINTDWCSSATSDLAKSVGVGKNAVAILPKFMVEEYKKYGIVESVQSIGAMDLDELRAYCMEPRQ